MTPITKKGVIVSKKVIKTFNKSPSTLNKDTKKSKEEYKIINDVELSTLNIVKRIKPKIIEIPPLATEDNGPKIGKYASLKIDR